MPTYDNIAIAINHISTKVRRLRILKSYPEGKMYRFILLTLFLLNLGFMAEGIDPKFYGEIESSFNIVKPLNNLLKELSNIKKSEELTTKVISKLLSYYELACIEKYECKVNRDNEVYVCSEVKEELASFQEPGTEKEFEKTGNRIKNQIEFLFQGLYINYVTKRCDDFDITDKIRNSLVGIYPSLKFLIEMKDSALQVITDSSIGNLTPKLRNLYDAFCEGEYECVNVQAARNWSCIEFKKDLNVIEKNENQSSLFEALEGIIFFSNFYFDTLNNAVESKTCTVDSSNSSNELVKLISPVLDSPPKNHNDELEKLYPVIESHFKIVKPLNGILNELSIVGNKSDLNDTFVEQLLSYYDITACYSDYDCKSIRLIQKYVCDNLKEKIDSLDYLQHSSSDAFRETISSLKNQIEFFFEALYINYKHDDCNSFEITDKILDTLENKYEIGRFVLDIYHNALEISSFFPTNVERPTIKLKNATKLFCDKEYECESLSDIRFFLCEEYFPNNLRIIERNEDKISVFKACEEILFFVTKYVYDLYNAFVVKICDAKTPVLKPETEITLPGKFENTELLGTQLTGPGFGISNSEFFKGLFGSVLSFISWYCTKSGSGNVMIYD